MVRIAKTSKDCNQAITPTLQTSTKTESDTDAQGRESAEGVH